MSADLSELPQPWSQLNRGVELPFPAWLTVPPLSEVDLGREVPPAVGDVERAGYDEVVRTFADDVGAGMTVAVGAGSRGLTDRVALLRGTVAGLRALGAEPFVVPAMGSHGGATAQGQRDVLAHLGITPETVDAEVRASMETVEVARTAGGMPPYLDVHAAAADRILPVNRTKPHTCFKGPIESGCTKMAVVGFGKQPGAAQIHSCGPIEMRDRLLDGVAALRSTGRLLGGVTSLEASDGSVVEVAGLRAEDLGGPTEQRLTDEARSLLGTLPFAEIDVLVIERGGKDISGTTLDPNVTGRFWVHDLESTGGPAVRTIVLLSITEVSNGNVLGIGLADFIPASAARQIDWQATYLNSYTAGLAGLRRSRMPMVLPDEESCVKAAMMMCGRDFDQPRRVVRVDSTLHLGRCWVSEPLLAELPPDGTRDRAGLDELIRDVEREVSGAGGG